MRILAVSALAITIGCAPPQPPQAQLDPSSSRAYLASVHELAALARQARERWKLGDKDQASALISQAQPLAAKALAVPRPPLLALEAASDLDQLYATMLLANRHYGWARMTFQKDLARWKNRTPQTPDTERRRQSAERGIADCDRQIAQ